MEPHGHSVGEEFLHILDGRGIATIDGAEHEVGPGDFMAFPTPSVAHGLRNPFDTDLLYIMGGERSAFELARFPRVGKHMIRDGRRVFLIDSSALEELTPRRTPE